MKLPLTALLLAYSALAHATDISVIGLFPGKAVLVVDQRAPKTYSAGSTVAPGVKLLDVSQTDATFDMDGKRQRIGIGSHVNHTAASSGAASTTLQADSRGHFMVQGQINGGMINMLVDTGASLIAVPASDAKRLGIDYRKGRQIQISTANGIVSGYMVMFNTVKVGNIVLNQVEGVVQESGLPFTLLGMSFLKRMEMRRDGEQMVLTKRY